MRLPVRSQDESSIVFTEFLRVGIATSIPFISVLGELDGGTQFIIVRRGSQGMGFLGQFTRFGGRELRCSV
ncbi:protein of unknown function [Candidatus Methylomirabilis oxygeniifera]|uniref:Uncharacterized protein n=1 Tax=Methylomirabilis oxygeniifera TaxID=671143 RepID=D5MHD7_METO1|nr:protein of unknown function [Candidatus Methylomirabilis oxyfera]